jgi:hypothetical protein
MDMKTTRKQADRKASLFPNEKPKYVRCYDNGGETADRYTIVFTGNYTSRTNGSHWVIGCSGDPFHPLGIGMTDEYDYLIDKPKYSHLGKKVSFDTLPEKVKQYVNQTYLYLWDFTDENGKEI